MVVNYQCSVIHADVYCYISSLACTSVVDITCSIDPTHVDYIPRVFALSAKMAFYQLALKHKYGGEM